MRTATENLNDNTKKRRFECLLILLIFKAVVSDNDQSSLFQTHRFTKTSVVLKSNLNAANQKIRLKSLLVLRTRENHPTLRKSANGIAASSPLRQNQSFEVKFLVPSQKLKWMLKYCSYLKYFLINQLQRYPSRVVYMFRQISYLGPELRAFSGQENLTFLRKFI